MSFLPWALLAAIVLGIGIPLKKMWNRRRKRKYEERLIKMASELVQPLECEVTGIGPYAVGVQGDARTFGPSLTVRFPVDATNERISTISTLIPNKVPGVTRVLGDIPS